MHQPYFGRVEAGNFVDAIRLANPFSTTLAVTTDAFPSAVYQPIFVAGTLRNLRIRLAVAPGVGASRTFRVHTVNHGATGILVTLSGTDTEASSTGVDVALSVGDFVYLRHTFSGVPAATGVHSVIEYDIDSTTSYYVFGGLNAGNIGRSTTVYDGLLYGGKWTSSADTRPESIVMVPGTITGYGVHMNLAPGTGATRTFTVFKNGVAQDGTGGTVDTRLVVTGSTTLASTTFSLPVLALDRVKIRQVPSSFPADANVMGGVTFVATNPGEFQIGAAPDDAVTIDATEYGIPNGRSFVEGLNWDPVEADREQIGPINSIVVSAMTVRVVNAPGLGTSVTLTVRKNSVDTDLVVTIPTATFQAGVDGSDVEIGSSDTWAIKGVSDGTTSPQITYYAYVASDPAITGSPSGSPSGGASPSPDEEPDRTPPVVTPVSPAECPCPEPGGSGPIDGGQPPGDPGNSGGNTGGEGWEPGSANLACSDDGTVNDYEIGTPGESLANVRDPRAWFRFGFVSFDDSDELTPDNQDWALDATMPDVPHEIYGGRKAGKAMVVSSVTRGMSDDNGNYKGASFRVQLNDKLRDVLRTRLGTSGGKYVWEREVTYYVASEANRQSGYTLANPREVARGLTYDVELGPRFTADFSCEDPIVSQFGAFGPDRAFSTRLLTLGLLPGCPRDLVGKPQQWIFGIVSDEGAVDISTGEPQSKGLVPLWLVGALGDEDEYHLAAHDIGGMVLYGSDGQTPPSRVPLTEGVDYRWETLDLTDADTGAVHRVTHVYLPTGSVPSEAHKSGGVGLAANVCGKLGANDQTITDLFKIYQAVFELLILPTTEYHTGPYPDGPFWGDGRAKIHSDSFADAQEFSIQRIGGDGYKGGFVLGGPGNGAVTLREILRRMSNSGDCWFTWTAAGQLKVVLLDDTTDVESAPILREPARLRALPSPRYAFDEVENPVLYAYDFDDDKQRFRVPQARIVNEQALTRMGRERPSPQPIEMRCVRDHLTARDVAARRLLRRQYPPAYFPVVEPIDGLDRDPGDIIRITSIEGPSSVGCVERPLFIKETTFDYMSRRTTHICRDLTDIITGFGEWASDSVDDWDTATEEEQESLVFWANDNDQIPTELAPGQEWR